MPVFPGCHLTQRGKSEVLSEGSLVPLPLSHGIVCSRPYHVRIMGRYVSGTGISSGGMRILVISDIPFG